MSDAHSISLTPKDFEVLEGLLSSPHVGLADASILIRRKLHAATLVFAEDIGPDVVTVNSRVRYRINGGSAEERTTSACRSADFAWAWDWSTTGWLADSASSQSICGWRRPQ